MTGQTSHVRVFKFDPAVETAPHFDSYYIPYDEGDTVLDLLNRIYENHDQLLSYRSACRKGKCGSCPVVVNGKPCFSCREPAAPELTVEPHPKFKLIKDLVVDFNVPVKQ